ncbi:hypothetical protein [Actinoplanes flavus]|uniref:Uncharacterized protein n=1 Tax=Actinoplanes flavus TaxID=2820290 RepID=A0ABS3UD26_9ACTN|nr:hypothetical protein [Actinoplanes flavus]MBO3736680.1 hypothetical protein [Actinoplanes flavus]
MSRRPVIAVRRSRKTILMAVVTAVAVGIGVLVVSGPASASVSKHHGKWMSQVAGCKSNFRIGKTARMVAENGADYGWVEWRASRTGACAGYQWVRLHFTRNLGFVADESDYKDWGIYYKDNPWGRGISTFHKYNMKVRGLRYFKAGAYNSRILSFPRFDGAVFPATSRWQG